MKKENGLSRRSFLKNTAAVGALGMIGTGSTGFLTSCSGGEDKNKLTPLKEA